MNLPFVVFTVCAFSIIPPKNSYVKAIDHNINIKNIYDDYEDNVYDNIIDINDYFYDNDYDDGIYDLVVLVHGISSTKEKLDDFRNVLINEGYNVFVPDLLSNETGGLINMNYQLYLLNQEIDFYIQNNNLNDNNVSLNMIGISQGGLLSRAYVQYYNKYNIKNLITIGTPHGGVYYKLVSDYVNYTTFYNFFTQLVFAPSNYWRDPYNYEYYCSHSSFLSALNNEVINIHYINSIYNLFNLNNFVMIWSPNDGVLDPPESGKFSTYAIINDYDNDDNDLEVQDYKDAPYYKALQLYNVNISVEEVDCYHTEYITDKCLDSIITIINAYL